MELTSLQTQIGNFVLYIISLFKYNKALSSNLQYQICPFTTRLKLEALLFLMLTRNLQQQVQIFLWGGL